MTYLLNGIFFTTVIMIAISVATIALTRKVNQYRTQSSRGIKATVIKKEVPILSYSRGVVKKINARVGLEVKKNAVLAELDNPSLRSKVDVLGAYEDNVSAQTEAKVAKEELKNLIITAPVDGVIADVAASEGSPVETLTKFMTIYSNNNVRLLAQLTVDQYQIIQKLPEVKAYSPRLNQNFTLKPYILSPDEKTPIQFEEKKIGLYFKLANESDASSLLQNEDLDLQLETAGEKIIKPVDYFVNFWNGLLLMGDTARVTRPN